MGDDFLGKAVSIECDAKLGVFQGVIKDISESEITIIRAFRNGVPLKKQDAEVTLRATDIVNIYLIPSFNGQNTVTPVDLKKPTTVKLPGFANAGKIVLALSHNKDALERDHSSSLPNSIYPKPKDNISELTDKIAKVKVDSSKYKRVVESGKVPCNNTVREFFGNLLPPKVEARLGAAQFPSSPNSVHVYDADNFDVANALCEQASASSRPIDIKVKKNNYGITGFPNGPDISVSANGNGNARLRYGNNGSSNNGSNRKQRKQLRKDGNMKHNQTFSASVDDPILQEDFDFEGNLALFNKQAIWDIIEAEQKPDLVRQTSGAIKKYRHDENILVSEPVRLRQIENIFDGSTDFVTDEGLIIPTIPSFVRAKIESLAEKGGLSLPRQLDILTRGVTDLAILLLGGARRLTPTNYHQWPIIVIICAKSSNLRTSDIGAATGRQMASHGLKVLLYLEDETVNNKSKEIALFSATDNVVVYSVDELPSPDLVILSTNSNTVTNEVRKWLSESRASVLAVDPPPEGIKDVCIKYAILPILPLNGISSNNYGKLYLCNLGIPDKFYRDAGIKYKSPFGHKFVIPIHLKE
ncbi:PREDICTED: enhancer of mRNA-decapping protein 3 isoform X2 [Rhagoletis zephyria]|uniref:enhancer of mRNA-decapping protein 3 isoform X2 n=1 Tax=Rhagoletis zephyria TaxID=28612 RepID=UPI0008113F3A|nr:PREDICTED: enhancer of mRNA-decapping protein 3 isoform X2 [Rhagoletis zephyria]